MVSDSYSTLGNLDVNRLLVGLREGRGSRARTIEAGETYGGTLLLRHGGVNKIS